VQPFLEAQALHQFHRDQVALVGLGYYPNPYGLEARDEVVFKLTKDKYGVEFPEEDNSAHERAARQEYFSIWRKDPGFVIRSSLGRLKESVTGKTTVLSFLFLSNVAYRILCVIGLVAMVWRGGDRRLLGIAAAGMYAIYVGLTCVFYFVGLAYDNVSQVTLFVMFMGLFDTMLYLGQRAYARFPALGVLAPAASRDKVPSGA